jgi:hypothetical protein
MAIGTRSTTTWNSRIRLLGLVAGFAVICAATAQAQQPPTFRCKEIIIPPGPDPDLPKIAPIFRSTTDLSENEFDCLAWQDFIYLMWPVTPGKRGVPNPYARLGASGPTVWESYKTSSAVFLPNGQFPGPWNLLQLSETLQGGLAQRVASGAVRSLESTSKVSRDVLANMLLSGGAIPPEILKAISQAGGGTLYDLNGFPVYYEIAVDQVEYDYIVQNKLYNADTQIAFAQTNVINLPAGATETTPGGVEVKAAWKVLTPAEMKSGRFHTIQALLGGAKTPVTMGLVGFHAFIANGVQGAWATFAQVDNAPAGQPATSGTFNFFNPKCTVPGGSTPCPINVKNADPGQVVQITPDATAADKLNTYMHYMLKQYDPKSQWQYYNLVDVQWALSPQPLSKLTPPVAVPLPNGTPNVPDSTHDMVNAVLETFLQKPGMGCLTCHQYATTVAGSGSNKTAASSYSFIFGHATAPPK